MLNNKMANACQASMHLLSFLVLEGLPWASAVCPRGEAQPGPRGWAGSGQTAAPGRVRARRGAVRHSSTRGGGWRFLFLEIARRPACGVQPRNSARRSPSNRRAPAAAGNAAAARPLPHSWLAAFRQQATLSAGGRPAPRPASRRSEGGADALTLACSVSSRAACARRRYSKMAAASGSGPGCGEAAAGGKRGPLGIPEAVFVVSGGGAGDGGARLREAVPSPRGARGAARLGPGPALWDAGLRAARPGGRSVTAGAASPRHGGLSRAAPSGARAGGGRERCLKGAARLGTPSAVPCGAAASCPEPPLGALPPSPFLEVAVGVLSRSGQKLCARLVSPAFAPEPSCRRTGAPRACRCVRLLRRLSGCTAPFPGGRQSRCWSRLPDGLRAAFLCPCPNPRGLLAVRPALGNLL